MLYKFLKKHKIGMHDICHIKKIYIHISYLYLQIKIFVVCIHIYCVYPLEVLFSFLIHTTAKIKSSKTSSFFPKEYLHDIFIKKIRMKTLS